MKKTLQIVAAVLTLAAVGVWAAGGANRGWTKTSVPIKTLDEVTGIEGISYEKKFVPGVDFLAGAILTSAILAGISFVIPKKRLEPPNTRN